MTSTMMILAGMMMMIWPARSTFAARNLPLIGNVLREAFTDDDPQPVPDEIVHLTTRVACELRLVGGTEQ